MNIELLDILRSSIQVATPGATTDGILGFQDGNLKLFKPFDLGYVPMLNINSPGRILTLQDTTAGVLLTNGNGITTFTIPTMARMGVTWNSSNPISWNFLFERGGNGNLIIGGSKYLGSVNSAANMVAIPNSVIGDFCLRSDVGGGTIYELNAASASPSTNWIARTGANTPALADVSVDMRDLEPQFLPLNTRLMAHATGPDTWVVG